MEERENKVITLECEKIILNILDDANGHCGGADTIMLFIDGLFRALQEDLSISNTQREGNKKQADHWKKQYDSCMEIIRGKNKEIEELKEENDRLDKELFELTDERDHYYRKYFTELESIESQNVKIKDLEEKNRELKEELNSETPYCPSCGSCGESGCCGMDSCLVMKCHYGQWHLKEYKEVAAENENYYQEIEDQKVKIKEQGEEIERLKEVKKEPKDITSRLTDF